MNASPLIVLAHLQGGGPRADYGRQILTALSADLSKSFGKGYSVTNLRYFRLFYQAYADRQPKIHHQARDEFARPMSERHKHNDPTRPVRVHIQDMDVEMHAVVPPDRVGEGIGSRMAALGPWEGESLAEITTILHEGRRAGGSALPPDGP